MKIIIDESTYTRGMKISSFGDGRKTLTCIYTCNGFVYKFKIENYVTHDVDTSKVKGTHLHFLEDDYTAVESFIVKKGNSWMEISNKFGYEIIVQRFK